MYELYKSIKEVIEFGFAVACLIFNLQKYFFRIRKGLAFRSLRFCKNLKKLSNLIYENCRSKSHISTVGNSLKIC